ncbi:MAG: transporter substrate-binding domain-containing protein [Bdellovibrio sp.]|nr:transporter substrate-binding domain-containing protein [Bdellovibrio sp.]
MKHFLGFAIFLFLIPCFAEKTLIVGIPFSIGRNQALTEFHNLVEASLKDAGFKMVLKPIAVKTTYEMLLAGDVDAISYDDLSNRQERDKVISTSFPISSTAAYPFYRKDNPVSLSQLKKFKGAVSLNNQLVKIEATKQHLKFKGASNPYHCIQMLVDKEINYCLIIKEVGLSAVNSNPLAKDTIVMGSEKFINIPVHFSMKKSLAAEMPKIEASLKKHLQGDLSKYPLIKDNLFKDFK